MNNPPPEEIASSNAELTSKSCGVTGCMEGEGTNTSDRAQHTDKRDLQRSLCLKNTKGLQTESTEEKRMGSEDLTTG